MTRYTFQIRTSKEKEQIRRLVRDIPAYLSGRRNDIFGIGRAFGFSFAQSMFSQIHSAFLLKSAGQADDTGERWATLAESTIKRKLAKIRRHGPRKQKRSEKKLTPTQQRIYEQVYASQFQRLKKEKGEKAARTTARRMAAKAVATVPKRLTGLGSASAVPILIDTGRLETSLRSGRLTSSSYTTPSRDQFVNLSKTHIEFGTRVPYSKYLMEGTPKMPARRLWPSVRKMKPWTAKAANEASQSVVRILKSVL